MTKHTPTPWIFKQAPKSSKGYYQARAMIIAKHPSIPEIDQCISEMPYTENDVANARHIVKCVNCHDELVKTAKRYLEITLNPKKFDDDNYETAKQELQQALAKAEEE